MQMTERSIPGRGHSKCEGPEAGLTLRRAKASVPAWMTLESERKGPRISVKAL